MVIEDTMNFSSEESYVKKKESTSFISTPGFCPDCGLILPTLSERGPVTCIACKREWSSEVFGDMAKSYEFEITSRNAYKSAQERNDSDDDADGPIVERSCPQCKNDKMSYATLQLRSADEGQTVFYTCTKCKYKEAENS